MITKRPASHRGHFDFGWLQTFHSFSFGNYVDPDHKGFRALRVINEDFIQPDKGFGEHGHKEMEILTWVMKGALEHRDSIGNGSVLRPGEGQRMSAGTGIRHAEFNPQPDSETHLLQIWIEPGELGIDPGWEQTEFPESERRGKLRLIASPDAADGSLKIHQDVRVYASLLDSGSSIEHELDPDRHAWVQVAGGRVTLNGEALQAGDGAAVSGESRLSLSAASDAEVLVFDLA